MKKTALLNIALSRTIAGLGHGDILVIGDAGLPVPAGVEIIDLALTPGIPDFASVLRVVLTEMQVERHVLADEMFQASPPGLVAVEEQHALGLLGTRERMSHEAFKRLSRGARAVIRSGECKPYSNIALIAGVTF
ncbi:D-ribose pyranase [Pseudomonas sp. S75]|uniref:D-ribose pyranase n=1 Tax=unclassified Pseudomonas TaxID=196821 RepID=UPI001905B80A|nr:MULTISPECIES: D-ribose pyranase [unclassified Pseudomonas]MBJ9974306.1 D-ribose pyranase [Pseudomonas sp. S30]MBK0151764.1 D-ribose pyranase [Pseudomonas sp. S75]